MAIQTRSQQKSSPVVHMVIAAAIVGAITVAAIIPLSRSSSERLSEGWSLEASIAPAGNASQRFAEEMALHEALTEATFGALEVSEASLAARAIADHDAAFPALVSESNALAAEIAAQVARAIAEHDALIEPFVS